uniref:Uncharacterized protein n=1 Tax=Cacopsylla melanoneura TaxID=428564 RepID=A0A8D8ZPU5_9HEMI
MIKMKLPAVSRASRVSRHHTHTIKNDHIQSHPREDRPDTRQHLRGSKQPQDLVPEFLAKNQTFRPTKRTMEQHIQTLNKTRRTSSPWRRRKYSMLEHKVHPYLLNQMTQTKPMQGLQDCYPNKVFKHSN